MQACGETRYFWCEHIITSPKNVKTLHEQIIADINQPFFLLGISVTICKPFVNICISPQVFLFVSNRLVQHKREHQLRTIGLLSIQIEKYKS